MARLSKDEIKRISDDLHLEGITFEPLRSELIDHLICDVETRLDEGLGFEEAWKVVKSQIPTNHFNHIQKETMELLNKKINPTQVFSAISLALLVFATLFKMLHLQGAGYLLLFFLVAASATLVVGTTRSIYVYKEFKGRIVMLLATAFIVTFIAALCFGVLKLPGYLPLLYFSVISICIFFPSLSLYFYLSKQKLKDHLLIKLTKENQGIIEKTALILIGFGLVFNYSSLLAGQESFIGVIFFVFSIILVGMYAYSLTWVHFVKMERPGNTTSLFLLISSSVAFIMFILPLVGQHMHFVVRQYFAYLPGVIFCLVTFVHYSKFSSPDRKPALAILSLALSLYPLLRLALKLGWFGEALPPTLVTDPFFMIFFLIFLTVLLIGYRKEKLFKTLVILMIASHMIPHM